MPAKFKKISYEKELNARQKEAYNFQRVSAVLAEYGFVTIRLTNDWECADFIAQHIDGLTFLKVQLKGSLTFAKKYEKKDLYICFWDSGAWYLFPHDEVLPQVKQLGLLDGTMSWEVRGEYFFATVSKKIKDILKPYRLEE
jgi:hypothetical protein